MPIILTSSNHVTSVETWLDSLNQSISQMQLYREPHKVAVPVKRLGHEGLFLDNPPIDSVDDLLSGLQKRHLEMGMLSIPVPAKVPQERWGDEISNLNGWIDTAGYTGCQNIRFYFADRQQPESTMIPFYKEVVTYAIDIGIAVHFMDCMDSMDRWLDELYSQIPQKSIHLAGIEKKCVSPEDLSRHSEGEHPVTLYSFSQQSTQAVRALLPQWQSAEQHILIEV